MFDLRRYSNRHSPKDHDRQPRPEHKFVSRRWGFVTNSWAEDHEEIPKLSRPGAEYIVAMLDDDEWALLARVKRERELMLSRLDESREGEKKKRAGRPGKLGSTPRELKEAHGEIGRLYRCVLKALDGFPSVRPSVVGFRLAHVLASDQPDPDQLTEVRQLVRSAMERKRRRSSSELVARAIVLEFVAAQGPKLTDDYIRRIISNPEPVDPPEPWELDNEC